MYKYGANFIGTDIAVNQIEYAKLLSKENNLNIEYYVTSAEETNFPDSTFDVITACQSHFYFNHSVFAPHASNMLKKNGKLAFLYMAWLPFEDEIAEKSEDLILKYNPNWNGCKETRHNIWVPEEYKNYFIVKEEVLFDVNVPFTIDSWNGRIKACRGIGAALPDEDILKFEQEHLQMLNSIGKETFDILHYCTMVVLQKI